MPEKCLYCGELAVIEDSVEGGREQKICIECGSIATDLTETKPADDNLFFDEDENENTTINEVGTDRSVDKELPLCCSCGITLGFKTSNDQLCPDCAELNDEEVLPIETTKDLSSTKKVESLSLQGTTTTSKCVSCGSENLCVDSVSGDDRLMCADCGTVNSDTILTNDAFHPESTVSTKYHVPTLPRFAERQRVQLGLTSGLSKISSLCSKLCFSSVMQTEAEDMFRQLFFHRRVLNVSILKKEYIAAVCLFVICRRNDLPVSLTHFKSDVGDFTRFLRAKQFVHKILNISFPHMSLTRQLTDVLHDLKFDPGMMAKVKDLLFLFRKAWLTQGRSRLSLIALAAYYIYANSDKCKKFTSKKQFCTQHKLPQVPRKLAAECEIFLLKLAQSLPWVMSKQIATRALPLYINDIIQYQDSLIHLIFEVEENVNSSTLSSLLVSNDREDSGALRRPLTVCTKKEKLLPSAAKRHRPNANSYMEQNIVIPGNINLDSPDLHETEFDEEINSYILSQEEQEKMRMAKMSIILQD